MTLHSITLRFADGTAMTRRMRYIEPGQVVMLDLPEHCAAVVGVELDYGHPAYRRYDRTPARLQIIPHRTRWIDVDHQHHANVRHHDAYRDSYVTPPRYELRPRRAAGWSGWIGVSIGF